MSLEITKEYRERVQKKYVGLEAHSSWAVEYTNGESKFNAEAPCYYSLFSGIHGSKLSILVVFFGKDKFKKRPWLKDWCDFIINRSFFSKAFITKDVKEGLKYGFEVNLEEDAMFVRGAMMTLRWAFEHTGFSWGQIRDMGFSEVESFGLAMNYVVQEKGYDFFTEETLPDRLELNGFNSNHLAISRGYKLSAFMGEGFTPLGYKAKSNVWGANVEKYFRNGIKEFDTQIPKGTIKEQLKQLSERMKG